MTTAIDQLSGTEVAALGRVLDVAAILAFPYMPRAGGGSIINIASMCGLVASAPIGFEHELDGALLLLASPTKTSMTGDSLVVDGEWTAR